ncbi:uncharacterized protein [Euphorbia lathyris]|uniref:uncharacterized protein n=1 Tax=Euphorbia lathyris TaxID=212925 RepID=UPI0033132F2E
MAYDVWETQALGIYIVESGVMENLARCRRFDMYIGKLWKDLLNIERTYQADFNSCTVLDNPNGQCSQQASRSKGDTSKKKHDQRANESGIQPKELDLNEVALPKLTKKCKYMQQMLDENPTHDMFEMFDDYVFGSKEEIQIFIGREDV